MEASIDESCLAISTRVDDGVERSMQLNIQNDIYFADKLQASDLGYQLRARCGAFLLLQV